MGDMLKNEFQNEYIKAQRKLFAVALSILRSADLAEEAVSIAVLKAYEKRSSLKNPEFFQTWIVRILMRTCYDMQKRRHFVAYDEWQETDHIAFDNYEIEFFSLISKLEKKEKEIIVLRFIYQMTLEEIAKVLCKPVSTVKSSHYRSLQKLKEEITYEQRL